MQCINCFEEIPDNFLFCHLCGTKQETLDIEEQVDKIDNKLSITGCSFNSKGRIDCKQWIKEFGFNEVAEAIDISLKQYLKFDQDEQPIRNSVNIVFSKIAGICANRKAAKEKPYIADTKKMLNYANKKYRFSEWEKQEYENYISRILYLYSSKPNYEESFETLFWELKRTNDEWDFMEKLKSIIEVLEVDE